MKTEIEKIVKNFGAEKLLKHLPQEDVRKSLDLVTAKELAAMLGLSYATLRTHMHKEIIPYPTAKINRRNYFTRDDANRIVAEWEKQKHGE